MKKVLFFGILLLAIFQFNNSYAVFATRSYAMNDDCYTAEGSNIVYIECGPIQCDLICIGGGNNRCSFDCAWECEGCSESIQIYTDARGEEMYDYMHNQIALMVYTGTYVNNIVDFPTNRMFYRSISWNYNAVTDKLNATLLITYEK